MKLLPILLLLIWWVASTLIRKASEGSQAARSQPPRQTDPTGEKPAWMESEREKKPQRSPLEEELLSWLEPEEVSTQLKPRSATPEVVEKEPAFQSVEQAIPQDQEIVMPPAVKQVHTPSMKRRTNTSVHRLHRLTRNELAQAIVLKEILDPPLARRPLAMRRSALPYRGGQAR